MYASIRQARDARGGFSAIRLGRRSFVRERGTAILFTTIILSLIFLALASGIMGVAVTQTKERVRYSVYKDEFAAAEEALNKTFAHVQFLVQNETADLPTAILATPSPVVQGFNILNYTMTQVSAGNETLTTGRWRGLTLYRLKYRASIRVRQDAYNDESSAPNYFVRDGVTMAQNFEITYIPLYLFAIFYDPVMEIAPGADMWVRGRVHCNGDAYFQANSLLNFYDRVSVAGDVYHGRHPDSGQSSASGTVNFSTASNFDGSSYSGSNLAGMARSSGDSNSDGWLTSLDTDWATAAANLWKGYLEDSTQGAGTLELPVPPSVEPHALIERALSSSDPDYSANVESQKFENKAGILISVNSSGTISLTNKATGAAISNTYYWKSSTSTAYATKPSGSSTKRDIVSTSSSTFYDQREAENVNAINIDVGYLNDALTLSSISSALNNKGIVYVTGDDRASGMTAVRLTNAETLPVASGTTGFTVASDRPVYIQGDYNTTNKTKALVAGDAITILSNGWSDSNSSLAISKRTPTATTINSVFLNGIVATTGGHYSGGVENYFRLLENWSGVNLTFSGSIIELWYSLVATGYWSGTGTVYNPPNRIWSWDTALLSINGPPGAPRVVEMARTEWELLNAEGE